MYKYSRPEAEAGIFKRVICFFVMITIFGCPVAEGSQVENQGENHRGNHGFRAVESEYIGVIKSEAILMEHVRTGAQLLYIAKEDEEKAFGVGFKTPAEDNTGVNHIIEHTVLNGSQRYPSRRIFVHMLNNSASTFLNAMTSRDFTTYIFSSRNQRDYQNLMRVYMDGVFFPRVLRDENIFRQEGWRYEPETNGYNGVVYNEMKGAYSGYESYLLNAIQKSLYPGTSYEYDSGGKPEAITTLEYERLIEVYKKNYRPSNAIIFLYGKQDLEETLGILNEEFLSKLPQREASEPMVRIQGDFTGGGEYKAQYPGDEKTGRTYMAINYSLCQTGDVETERRLALVSALLAKGGSSPLEEAVRSLGVCDDVYVQYDNSMNHSAMSVILEGVDPSKKDLIVKTVQEAIKEAYNNGFSSGRVEAVINKMEFDTQNMANLSKLGVKLNNTVMRCFAYGQDILKDLRGNLMFGSLAGLVSQEEMRELLKEYYIDNERKSVVILTPGEVREENPPEITREIVRKAKEFREWQQRRESAIERASLPELTKSDIGQRPSEPEYFTKTVNGINYSYTKVPDTNGIVGIEYYFDASGLPAENIPFAKLLGDMMGTHLEAGGLTRGELSSRLNLYTGEFYSRLEATAKYTDQDIFSPKFVMGIKTLEKNLIPATELLNSVALDTKTDNKEHFREFIMKYLNLMETRLAEEAPKYAAKAGATSSGRYEEEIHGYSYFEFLQSTIRDIDKDWERISSQIEDTKSMLISKNNFLISVTGSPEAYESFLEAAEGFGAGLNSGTVREPVKYSLPAVRSKTAFLSPEANVNYIYQTGSYKRSGWGFDGGMLVAAGILNYDYLWGKIRDEGGAYGAGINISAGGEVMLRSYRDPRLRQTLEVYNGATKFLKDYSKSGKSIQGGVVKTVTAFDEFYRMENFWHYGAKVHFGTVAPEELKKIRGEILNADLESVNKFADLLEQIFKEGIYSVAGRVEAIAGARELFEEIKYLY